MHNGERRRQNCPHWVRFFVRFFVSLFHFVNLFIKMEERENVLICKVTWSLPLQLCTQFLLNTN